MFIREGNCSFEREEVRQREEAFPYRTDIAEPRAKFKKIDGTQETNPITEWFYDQGSYELVLRRWATGRRADEIRVFGDLDLTGMDTSYIQKLDSMLIPEIKNALAKEDFNHFIYFIKVISTAINMVLNKDPSKITFTGITETKINKDYSLLIRRKNNKDIIIRRQGQILALTKEAAQELSKFWH